MYFGSERPQQANVAGMRLKAWYVVMQMRKCKTYGEPTNDPDRIAVWCVQAHNRQPMQMGWLYQHTAERIGLDFAPF